MTDMSEEEIQECRTAFNVFDTDKGGTISVDELGKVMSVIGVNLEKYELEDMVNEIDEDGNGEIDFQEFLQLMLQKKQEQKIEENLIEAFEMLDIECQQSINLNNLKKVTEVLNVNLTEEELQEMIDEADIDNNQKVSYAEFKRIMQAQPQSQINK